MPNLTIAEENYIKSIFHIQQAKGNVSTNELAAKLGARPASVTDMLKKLKGKKLLHYEPYQEFSLSNEGRKHALLIIRKHRLWEYFLAETLQFGWDEVHEVAEQLEHVSSKKLIDKLDAFLKYPRFDPHGDPIPDSNGKMSLQQQICLCDLPVQKAAVVSMVSNQSAELLELLKEKKIALGSKIEVKKKYVFDNSVEIKVNNSMVHISGQLACVLFVKPLHTDEK